MRNARLDVNVDGCGWLAGLRASYVMYAKRLERKELCKWSFIPYNSWTVQNEKKNWQVCYSRICDGVFYTYKSIMFLKVLRLVEYPNAYTSEQLPLIAIYQRLSDNRTRTKRKQLSSEADCNQCPFQKTCPFYIAGRCSTSDGG